VGVRAEPEHNRVEAVRVTTHELLKGRPVPPSRTIDEDLVVEIAERAHVNPHRGSTA